MEIFFSAWLDMVAALGLIIALSAAYARLRRFIKFPKLGQLALGVCFGLVAALEMNHPIEPFDGLIIDLRTVPIALAGAFLSWPAAVVATLIGLAARAYIGGVGMWAGMLGMILAVEAGRLWAYLYRNQRTRGFSSGIVLAAMMSVHLLAGLILPFDIAMWFFSAAAPILLLCNMVTVPLLAAILEAERRSIEDETSLREAAIVDQDTGLLSLQAMQRECTIRAAALGDGSFSYALVVRIRVARAVSLWKTTLMQKRLVASMRLRLQDALPHCDLASVSGHSTLLLPVTQAELLHLENTKTVVRRAACDEPYAMNGDAGHRISVDVSVIDLSSGNVALDEVSLRGRRRMWPRRFGWRQAFVRTEALQRERRYEEPKLETLFAKADFLINQKSGLRITSR